MSTKASCRVDVRGERKNKGTGKVRPSRGLPADGCQGFLAGLDNTREQVDQVRRVTAGVRDILYRFGAGEKDLPERQVWAIIAILEGIADDLGEVEGWIEEQAATFRGWISASERRAARTKVAKVA